MQNRLRYIMLALATLLLVRASAQDMGLRPGDAVPDFEIAKIINSAKRTARISDFRDQLLIVDFWSINCKGCIEALPHMDSLQKQFGNKIKILPVTWEEETVVSAFWKRNSYTRNLSLPSVVEDKVFAKHFKHRTIPHEIWVYKGKVVAVTTSQYVEAENIEKVLSGATVNFPVKNDYYVFDGTKELLFKPDTDQVHPSSILKYAAISDYKEGVNSEGFSGGAGIVRDPVNKTVRAFFLNQPIYNSYFLNMLNGRLISASLIKPTGQYEIGPNEILWEVGDRNKYTYISKPLSGYEQDWIRRNGICFESLNPDTGQSDQQVYRTINNDMNRLLGLNVRWEKRREKVLVLTRTTSENKLPAEGSIAANQKISTGNMVGQLNSIASNPYVFNEARFDKTAYLNLSITNWKDIAAVRRAIQPYGLDLKEEERDVDKLVFSEVAGGLLVDGQMVISAKSRRAVQRGMKNPEQAENTAFLTANKSRPGVITLPSGLQYKVLEKGTGAKPALSDKVSVHFTGTLVNGKIFDSSYEQGRPFSTALTDVIKGWQEALQLMPVGSKWAIYVPAELAYGSASNSGQIPPNSVLIFEIELLRIIR